VKHLRIFQALTDVREEYIQEAAPPARPKRQWWKAGAGLAACLCLVTVLITLPFGGRGGDGSSESHHPPGWTYNLTTGPDGQSVYFCHENAVYRHTPGDNRPTRLADFDGAFRQTETGFYCTDQTTGDVYRVEGTQLFRLGTIPVNEDVIRRFQFIDYENDTLYWSCEECPDSGPENVVYATDCTGSQTLRLFSTPDPLYHVPLDQYMTEGGIYFMAKGGILQRYDLETQEVMVVYNHFWSWKAEPKAWFFFEDFILCQVIQYAPNDQGTHDIVGHPFYILPYDGSDACYLANETNYDAPPVYWDGLLWYATLLYPDGEKGMYLVSCDPATGEITPIFPMEDGPDHLAVCDTGLYYTEKGELRYYDFGAQRDSCILEWDD